MAGRTLLQFFHWYLPPGGGHWADLAQKAASLKAMGITDVWLPPAYKGAAGGMSVGYDVYDLFDLGEFDQKGSIATKYGDRAALQDATAQLSELGIGVLLDVVFNHKIGADELETVTVRRVDPEDRTQVESDAFEATAYTRFTFPARQGKYSQFIWDKRCFGGVDYLAEPEETGVFKLMNEYGDGEWNTEVDDEKGNFDYLMGADVEFRNNAVYEELKYWGRWVAGELPCAGFRLDAAKHIPAWFFRDWVGHVRETISRELFVVAEYWHPDMDTLRSYLDLVDQQLMLFDVALHHNFHHAAKAGESYDMRQIFDGTLVSAEPDHAVTLVANHDTQPLQSLESPVDPWFKPLAYALILMREQGVPCVFHPDLYGADYSDTGDDGALHEIHMPVIAPLPKLIEARQRFANGPQDDIFDDAHCLAVLRHGTETAPGSVTILTNGPEARKTLCLGPEKAARRFHDFLGHRTDEVVTDKEGNGVFPVNGGSVSIWVEA